MPRWLWSFARLGTATLTQSVLLCRATKSCGGLPGCASHQRTAVGLPLPMDMCRMSHGLLATIAGELQRPWPKVATKRRLSPARLSLKARVWHPGTHQKR